MLFAIDLAFGNGLVAAPAGNGAVTSSAPSCLRGESLGLSAIAALHLGRPLAGDIGRGRENRKRKQGQDGQ